MSPLFLSVALSTLIADTGRIAFRGAVVAPTCSHHDVGGPHIVKAGGCYQGTRPTVAGPVTDPATVALTGKDIPTWRLAYR